MASKKTKSASVPKKAPAIITGSAAPAKSAEAAPAKATEAAPVNATDAAPAKAETISTPAARMAAQGAPVDLARVTRVKQAIASGNYPVDPDKIAEKMLDLDLPPAKH